MSYDLRDHTADVAVEARATSLDDVFGAVADGMAAAMCDEIPETGGERFELTVTAEGRQALLFDYLDELIYERDVRVVLPVDNEVSVSTPSADGDGTGEWRLSGSARGVPLASVEARDLKAVTYSEMDISETDDGWHAYVVFDV